MHPVVVVPDSTSSDGAADAPGEDDLSNSALSQFPPSPSPLLIVRGTPARPRVAPGSAAPSETPAKADVPQIAPQLSAAETASAQQQTNQSLNVAGKNLEATQGRTLNGSQADLVSKIRSFIAEARDAGQSGDWIRARNAAKKAEVLSQELASSM